ncbi:hypothetical protein F9C07_2122 [Aspergillus flavus]|uniref:Uncharacterized protein n=1 Tax=Aspergillus flavus (strain ATCC 200026 / FGSC A1120 / IAM 13836 / NRRL 3357 / JCM 12722 / SRRC 167) TaxID=332952 RepID=A0A7U2QSL3_ASPFN|nr:hypothetical protein F9C07_2122 [Aspergillus flavus]
MDLPSEWLCSIQLFVLYAGSLASMLTGFLIDGQTSLVSLLLYRTLALEPWQIAFDNDHQLSGGPRGQWHTYYDYVAFCSTAKYSP